MSRDTEETRRRLKEAATAEFAAYGLHGTTVERIADRARVNKERLYHYYGGKEGLFAAVLADELAKVAAAVPLRPGPDWDIGDYAGAVFDYHAANPQLMRLLHWEALAYGEGPVPDQEERIGYYREKVEAFASRQQQGAIAGQLAPDYLLFLILGLCGWWFSVPQLASMITSASGQARAERLRRRNAVVSAARRLAGTTPTSG